MRKVPAIALLNDQYEAGWNGVSPCADGYEYPLGSTQRTVLKAGNFTAKPMMIGTNLNESALFRCGTDEWRDVTNETSFRVAVTEDLGLSPPSYAKEVLDNLVQLYDPAQFYGGSWQRAYVDVTTDVNFYCDSRFILDHVSAAQQPAFQYHLAHTPIFLTLDKCWGVPHASDLFMLWGNTDELLTKEGRELGHRMREYWKNFATNHSAPPGQGFPLYGGAEERQYLELNTPTDTPQAQWQKDQCDYLDTVLK